MLTGYAPVETDKATPAFENLFATLAQDINNSERLIRQVGEKVNSLVNFPQSPQQSIGAMPPQQDRPTPDFAAKLSGLISKVYENNNSLSFLLSHLENII